MITNLQKLRLKKGFTKSDLAREAGVSRNAIHHIEFSLRTPYRETLLKLAMVLGCEIEDLLDNDDDDGSCGRRLERLEDQVRDLNVKIRKVKDSIEEMEIREMYPAEIKEMYR